MAPITFSSKASQTKVATIAQADWPRLGTFEAESNGKTTIERRLWPAPPSADEVPKRESLIRPLKHLNLCGWKSPNHQLFFNLTNER